MLDVMLDLETMGNGPQAAICAIGAVEFDLAAGELGESWYSAVSLASSVDQGGVIDASTVLWWLQQGDSARAAVASGVIPIDMALANFRSWMEFRGPRDDVRLWGNGAAFDNVILASAYRRARIDPPWKFWNDRCYRTVKGLHPHIKSARGGTHHHALDDAVTQARHLIAMLGPVRTAAA